MSMTKYERAKVAEFYGDVVADILNTYLSEAEEKEKCRPGVDAPKAADNDDVLYSISHGDGNVKYNERTAKACVRSKIKSRENHNGFPALFFYPNGERRLAKWTDIRT